MSVIYINFTVNSGTRVTGGHHSSNGWVTSWVDYTTYDLTVSSKNLFLSLEACEIIKKFRAKYSNKEEKDQDWGVYIDDSSYSSNIDITPLLQSLNEIQKTYKFQPSEEPQEFNVTELLSFAEKEYNSFVSIVNTTERELKDRIERLKKEYESLKLQRIFPHFRNLVIKEQINFQEYVGDYYPLDIIGLNGATELLIQSIIKYPNAKYERINEIYTLLMISDFSYVGNGIECGSLSENDKETVNLFIRNLEDNYGKEVWGKNIYGNEQFLKPKLLKGMLDTVMHYLLKGNYESYDTLMQQPIYNRQNYIFDGMLKFAYLSDERWDKFSFSETCKTQDKEFFEGRILGSICTHSYWKPFLNKILDNQSVIERLAQIFFFKDNEISKLRILNRLNLMIERCETNHENYPFFW